MIKTTIDYISGNAKIIDYQTTLDPHAQNRLSSPIPQLKFILDRASRRINWQKTPFAGLYAWSGHCLPGYSTRWNSRRPDDIQSQSSCHCFRWIVAQLRGKEILPCYGLVCLPDKALYRTWCLPLCSAKVNWFGCAFEGPLHHVRNCPVSRLSGNRECSQKYLIRKASDRLRHSQMRENQCELYINCYRIFHLSANQRKPITWVIQNCHRFSSFQKDQQQQQVRLQGRRPERKRKEFPQTIRRKDQSGKQ